MLRNNILLRRLLVLKNVALPNGRIFCARVSTGNLPENVRTART